MGRRATKLFSSIAAVGIGIVGAGLMAQPASATPPPANECVTACTATFNTAGPGQTFTIPTGISALRATIAGSAGAPASLAITQDPTAVGGGGGVATLDLGASYAGSTLTFGVGALGAGTSLQSSDNTLLAVAGGGGGGGYAAYFQWVEQILATYPGGDGASPSTPGVTAGGDGTAFGTLAANGMGGTAVGGQAGMGAGNTTGSTNGTLTTIAAGVPTLGTGGVGGTLDFAATSLTHIAGNGGGGYTGGGGGAVQRNVPGGDVDVDVVAPGGGGSAFLDAALTATAEAPNTGGGYVSFIWDYAPTIENPIPGATPGTPPVVKRGALIPVRIAGLPAAAPFSVLFNGEVVASGTTDASGTAIASFTIPETQSAGTFTFTLRVGSVTVAESDPIVVEVPKPVDPGTGGPGVTDPGTDIPVVTDPKTDTPSVTVPAAVATTNPTAVPAGLASTGTAFVGGLGVVAGVLLVAGAAVFFLGRRRRTTAPDTAASDTAASKTTTSPTDES